MFHHRRKPVKNKFSYPVRMAVVNLDNPPAWFDTDVDDHLSADQARALAGTKGPVELLTHPASLGYVQNPISVYYWCAAKSKILHATALVFADNGAEGLGLTGNVEGRHWHHGIYMKSATGSRHSLPPCAQL